MAGQAGTIEADLAHVIVEGTLTRTTALTLTPAQRSRLRGAQIAGPPPMPDHQPTRTQRRVSARGDTQIIGQRVPVGLSHAGRIVTIEIDETVLRIYNEGGDQLINQIPRTSTKALARFKAYGVDRNRTTG
jgi:hypothetical protein